MVDSVVCELYVNKAVILKGQSTNLSSANRNFSAFPLTAGSYPGQRPSRLRSVHQDSSLPGWALVYHSPSSKHLYSCSTFSIHCFIVRNENYTRIQRYHILLSKG